MGVYIHGYLVAYSKQEMFSGIPQENPYQALSQLDQYETPRYQFQTTLDGFDRRLPDLPLPPGHPAPGGPPGDIGPYPLLALYLVI